MASLIVILGCLLLGVVVGWTMATRPDSDRIDRFYLLDQQHYERWKSYCELVKGLDRP